MEINFSSLLWIWKGSDGAGRWYFLTVPEALSSAIKAQAFELPRGFGSVEVEARIPSASAGQGGDVVWRTSLFPLNKGGYVLPVKAEVRRQSGIRAGDAVSVSLSLI